MRITGEKTLYGRIEISFDGQVPISYVKIMTPSAKTETVFPFKNRPVDFIYDEEGLESAVVKGEQFYSCRYTPTETGDFTFEAWSADALISSEKIQIDVGNSHGYVEVSQKDRRYFAYTDGTPFFFMGINLCFPTSYEVSNGKEFGRTDRVATIGLRQYASWFKKCAKNGVNVVRLWLGHSYFTPDTEDTYSFSDVQWAKIDHIVALARQYDIKLKITMENFRDFREGAQPPIFHKKLKDNGVYCSDMVNWLTDSRFEEAWLYKVREFAKRYGGDPTVCIIELWNEANTVSAPYDLIIKWNQKMLPYIKTLFPKQLVTNSLGSLASENSQNCYRSFCWEKADIIQLHSYLDQGAKMKICGGAVIPFVKDAIEFMRTDKKPLILAETGAVNNCHSGEFRYYSSDDRGIIFVDCVYTPLFLGSAGCGNIWHWDRRYVESKNLYKYFSPLARLIKDVDFASERFEVLDFSTDTAYILVLKGKNNCLGFIRNKMDSWFSTLRDDSPITAIANLTLSIDVTAAVLYPIWDEDTTQLRIENGKPVFENVLYGALFNLK